MIFCLIGFSFAGLLPFFFVVLSLPFLVQPTWQAPICVSFCSSTPAEVPQMGFLRYFDFLSVGLWYLSWSAARTPPKRTSSDRVLNSRPRLSLSRPCVFHDKTRPPPRLIRRFNSKNDSPFYPSPPCTIGRNPRTLPLPRIILCRVVCVGGGEFL